LIPKLSKFRSTFFTSQAPKYPVEELSSRKFVSFTSCALE